MLSFCRCFVPPSEQEALLEIRRLLLQQRAEELLATVAEDELLRELPSSMQKRGSRRLSLFSSTRKAEDDDDEPVYRSLGGEEDEEEEIKATDPDALPKLIDESLSQRRNSLVAPLMPRRIVTDDVKEAVHTVMVPKLLQKNVELQQARKKLRANQITQKQCRDQTRKAGNEFDLACVPPPLQPAGLAARRSPCMRAPLPFLLPLTYVCTARACLIDAAAIRAAKELANELGEVPLRKLVSNDESWNQVEQYAETAGVSLRNFVPRSMRLSRVDSCAE